MYRNRVENYRKIPNDNEEIQQKPSEGNFSIYMLLLNLLAGDKISWNFKTFSLVLYLYFDTYIHTLNYIIMYGMNSLNTAAII